MSLLVDEGSGISTTWGRTFGLPAVAEKGKFNLNMTVSTLGGHSSVPPKHTNIGMTSLLVAALEKNPHPVILEEESPIWGFLQCAANFAPDMPKGLKKSVGKAQGSKKAFEELPEEVIDVGLGGDWATPGMGDMTEALLSTTQAADIIYGGVKVNALVRTHTASSKHPFHKPLRL
jgi:Gly-Xaa carboxypeptidase